MAAPHALVIGGTGMLRDLSLALAGQGRTVSVVARHQEGLAGLERAAAGGRGRIHPIALDYRNTAALTEALAGAIASSGRVDLAVAWIHGTAPEAPLAVARAVASPDRPVHYFHVLGSAAADPSRLDPGRRAGFEAIPGLIYHEVILGFVLTPHGSRWLTNQEISTGVLRALDAGEPRYIVGTVEPWSARP